MMNLPANEPAAPIGRVQAITLGQIMLQRPVLRAKNFANGAIPAFEHCDRRSAMRPLALVMNPAIPFCAAHSCSKIRQVKPRARDGNRKRVTCVQAEKPHAWPITMSNVSTNIQFREGREPRECGRPAQPYTGHAK